MSQEPFTALGEELDYVAHLFPAPPGVTTQSVRTDADISMVASHGMKLDYRTYAFPGYCAPATAGLNFDTGLVSTHSFVTYRKREPVALCTLVFEPRGWLDHHRFFVSDDEGIRVDTLDGVLGLRPSCALVPGWALVAPGRNLELAGYRVRLLIALLEHAATRAPSDCWHIASAQGFWPTERKDELEIFRSRPVGSRLADIDLPPEFKTMGTPRPESRATAKFAALMGWPQLPRVAEGETLGPVFAHPVNP